MRPLALCGCQCLGSWWLFAVCLQGSHRPPLPRPPHLTLDCLHSCWHTVASTTINQSTPWVFSVSAFPSVQPRRQTNVLRNPEDVVRGRQGPHPQGDRPCGHAQRRLQARHQGAVPLRDEDVRRQCDGDRWLARVRPADGAGAGQELQAGVLGGDGAEDGRGRGGAVSRRQIGTVYYE